MIILAIWFLFNRNTATHWSWVGKLNLFDWDCYIIYMRRWIILKTSSMQSFFHLALVKVWHWRHIAYDQWVYSKDSIGRPTDHLHCSHYSSTCLGLNWNQKTIAIKVHSISSGIRIFILSILRQLIYLLISLREMRFFFTERRFSRYFQIENSEEEKNSLGIFLLVIFSISSLDTCP